MKITVLTLFPEMFNDFLKASIVGRAIAKEHLQVEFVQIRDFALDKYKHVDDSPFGGGAGMVMKCQPVLDALYSVKEDNSYTVMMSPIGKVYDQAKAHQYAKKEHLILLCGHYEGFDARINDHCDELISIGDYVLSGGEVAAMVIIDSIARLLKGVIKDESTLDESHENGLLEYPQYTQPADYKGVKVPAILTSGNHQKIAAWRKAQALLQTRKYRPDIFAKYELSEEDEKLMEKYGEKNYGE